VKKDKPLSIVETASAYLGYTARQQNNTFAISTGYTGTFQWDGSFVDRVLRESGYNGVPSHANTTTALSFYTKNYLLRRVPKPGDIVFYSFSAQGGTATFDPPHIGIVTDTSRWRVDGAFKAIEGQVNSGQPKGPTEENGVYERTRYAPDVLTFARMPWKLKLKLNGMPTLKKNNNEVPLVIPAHLTRCMTTQQASTAKPQYRKAVEAVQLALASHPGVNFRNADRGVFNLKSRSAFAAFQRFNGVNHSAADGVPDENSLSLLAEQTNLQFFRAE